MQFVWNLPEFLLCLPMASMVLFWHVTKGWEFRSYCMCQAWSVPVYLMLVVCMCEAPCSPTGQHPRQPCQCANDPGSLTETQTALLSSSCRPNTFSNQRWQLVSGTPEKQLVLWKKRLRYLISKAMSLWGTDLSKTFTSFNLEIYLLMMLLHKDVVDHCK